MFCSPRDQYNVGRISQRQQQQKQEWKKNDGAAQLVG